MEEPSSSPGDRRAADAAASATLAARGSYGRLLAALVARTRDMAAAEDALAEALARALETWPRDGVPRNPDAWLLTAARHAAIDARRRERAMRGAAERAAPAESTTMALSELFEASIPDERLKMLFLCAHPAIDPAARTPLLLQAVMGLDARAIASAFLLPPATLAQRLVRAKARIREAGIALVMPAPAALPARLGDVLRAIYAAYTAGWDRLAEGQDALAAEALWLGRELRTLLPGEPEVLGLLSLMLFSHARRRARRDARGAYVPVAEQDCSLWEAAEIEEAESSLRTAASFGSIGRFQLEAAVQSAHAARRRTGRTDWGVIVSLYDGVLSLGPTVGAAVARAAALGAHAGAPAGLAALADLDERELADHQPYWATKAHLLREAADRRGAAAAYRRAAGLSADPAVREFLLARADSAESGLAGGGGAR